MQIKGDQNENFWWVKGSIVNSNLIDKSQCKEKRKNKLSQKYYGPFEIVDKIGTLAYRWK
jgi:hypothetical protein